MRLHKIRGGQGDIYISPQYEIDMPLFKHCTGGRDAWISKTYRKELMPILLAHGIRNISIVDRSRKQNISS